MSLPIVHTPLSLTRVAALAVVVLGALAIVTAAQASTTIGQTGSQWYQHSFAGGQEIVSDGYVVPAGGGIIVSLNTLSSSCVGRGGKYEQGTYNLQVLRPLGGNEYKVLGDTGNQTDPCDGQLHSYPVNIPVQAGDVLGVYVVSAWVGILVTGGNMDNFISQPAVGDTISLPYRGYGLSADESGTLNPDADLALAQPSDVTVNASSSAGAVVTYSNPAASDEDLTTVTVSCLPASGSTFAIGDTTVTCTATDSDGDTNSPVTKTFTVHVKGAAKQLADLATAVKGIGAGTSLADQIAAAQSDLAAGDTSDGCGTLKAFIHTVKAQPAKSIPANTASSLINAAKQIEAVIGCSS
jgi:hypothetical protein